MCTSGGAIETYDSPGTCSAGTCNYAKHDLACVGACSNLRCTGAWEALAETGTPYGRYGHTAVWTGHEMIVWGGAASSTGSYGDGARFDPATGTWTPISSTNAPSARREQSAVWTGTEMIVWGGSDITQGYPHADGGRYDPTTDTWTPIAATTDAPAARFGHSAVWTGHVMIVWGGADASTDSFDDGAAFDPTTGTWTPIALVGAPYLRRDHAAVWTGSEMIVYGGSSISAGGQVYDDTYTYDPMTDTWSLLATTGTPTARFAPSAVWDGNEMIMWGGGTSSTYSLDDGARLDPTTGAWTALPSANAPAARRDHTAVWTGSEILMWGGSTILDGGGVYDTGAVYAIYGM
jgi:N-acetylneuraminic acid mutarotase